MRQIRLIALSLLLATPALADSAPVWRQYITAFDLDRLTRYDAAVAAGTMEAEIAKEPAGSMQTLLDVMQAETIPVNLKALKGKYACRTLKAGGPFVGLVVYGWFNCRITLKDGGVFYEKTTGSQRQSGFIYQRDEKSALLLAAPNQDHAGPVRPYSGPKGGITDPQLADELGVVSALKDGRLRIVFPYPVLESTYNVLELKRR